MSTQSCSWAELAMPRDRRPRRLAPLERRREPREGRRARHEAPHRFELAVAPDCALDAFHHPFLYAGARSSGCGARTRRGGRRLTDPSPSPSQRRRERPPRRSEPVQAVPPPTGGHPVRAAHSASPSSERTTQLHTSKEKQQCFAARATAEDSHHQAGRADPEPRSQLRRPCRPVECESLEDRRSRVADLRRRAVCRRHIGTKQIDQNEANVGESRNGDRILREAGFTVDKKGENVEAQSQTVLIQSTTLTVTDPAFQAALADTEKTLRTFPQVHSLHSPLTPRYTELTSKDGHSAMVSSSPRAPRRRPALHRQDRRGRRQDRGATPGLTFDSIGVSTEKALDKEIQGGLAKAGMISIPLTIIILMIVLGALVGSLIPLLVGAHVRHGSVRPRRALEPGHRRQREHHGSDPAGRPRGRSRLLALLHAP